MNNKIHYTLLNSEMVRQKLINLSQLVFEVTDACNLKCKYCGYGELYNHYDERHSTNMPFEQAVTVLEYMDELWSSNYSASHQKQTYISFYGGEHLLNIPFIKEVISWVEKRNIPHCKFVFTMTTNALLLDKYMDFLVEKNFRILVSLDGDEYGHSYRVDHGGHSSFLRVHQNLKLLQQKYPEFFEKNISFNAVLHDRNDYPGLIRFFKEEFDKIPKVSELNSMGIRDDRMEEFAKMRHTRAESIAQAKNQEILKETIFMDDPQTSNLCSYLHTHSGNVFKSYIDLLTEDKNKTELSVLILHNSNKSCILILSKTRRYDIL